MKKYKKYIFLILMLFCFNPLFFSENVGIALIGEIICLVLVIIFYILIKRNK